jgi:hypothetical protein
VVRNPLIEEVPMKPCAFSLALALMPALAGADDLG